MNCPAAPPAFPRATYRLQFNEHFRFEEARASVPYLAALGISHVYGSPLLMARPGSTHGYDIVDHNRLNPEIGSPEEFDAFLAALRAHGMGFILDFVPNHMGVGLDNPWWVDVLEWGKASPFSEFFDIDWEPLEASLAGKVLLPVLGDHYGASLERGDLQVCFDEQRRSLAVCYFENRFPLAPKHYPSLLAAAGSRAGEDAGELKSIVAEFEHAIATSVGARRETELYERLNELKLRFGRLCVDCPAVMSAVAQSLDELNGQPGKPESFDSLHRLLERQVYRLAYWRVATHEINYRRFFDINDLAALCMERPQVFDACHQLIGRWIEQDKVQGLRLDHVDGLRYPGRYLQRLQSLAAARRQAASDASGIAPSTGPGQFYVLVEKILAPHEALRKDWPVAGTTGYEFMNAVNGIFVDPAGERRLSRYYNHFVGAVAGFEEVVLASKRQIIQDSLASELHVLANLFHRLAKQSRGTRDYALTSFRQALANIAVFFPVYRTYVTEAGAWPEDRRDLDWALARARRAERAPDRSIYDFIHDALTLDLLEKAARREFRRRDVLNVALKFQQLTGPLMAKSMEDTAFYRYLRLVSLNEVGGEPSHFGVSATAFHEANRRRLRDYPLSMVTTATHDHKRGEDVRARLNVLSEIPSEWAKRVRRWVQLNNRKKRAVDGRPAPDPNDEYLFYQTVVGTWPCTLQPPNFEALDQYRERLSAYTLKAAREAKLRTSWAAPDEAYEQVLLQFVESTLDLKQGRAFLEDIGAFADRIAVVGVVNSLSQVVLKYASPGVPDTYQGTELWDLSLVDPDNRRPVDYRLRRCLLQQAEDETYSAQEMLARWRDGGIKQSVIQDILNYRKSHPLVFTCGSYEPLKPSGRHSERVIGFVRQREDDRIIVVATRFSVPLLNNQPLPLPTGWDDTAVILPKACDGSVASDILSRRTISLRAHMLVAELLSDLPVAVLATTGAG